MLLTVRQRTTPFTASWTALPESSIVLLPERDGEVEVITVSGSGVQELSR